VKSVLIGTSTRKGTFFAIGGLFLSSLGIAGCGVSGTTAPLSTTSTVLFTTPSAQHEFKAAHTAWVNGSIAPSFQQSMFFSRAALLLTIAVTRGVSNVAQYSSSIGDLKQLSTLPETDDTSLQKSEARHDIRALDRFFSTTGLYQ
jgi:hypothetical protein